MKVIIADDRETIRYLYRELLSAHGCEIVAETSNGCDALAFYFELSPDLLIIDHHMEAMNGIDVVRHIAGRNGRARIIMCTACPEEVRDEAIRLGVADVLPKPFELDRLVESVFRGVHT